MVLASTTTKKNQSLTHSSKSEAIVDLKEKHGIVPISPASTPPCWQGCQVLQSPQQESTVHSLFADVK